MTYVNKTSVLGIGVLFIISNISAVSARFYVRRTKAGYGLDDWLCIPALVLVIAECCIMIIGPATNSVGAHHSKIGTTAKMQFNLVAVLMLRLAALNIAAPGVAPEAKADAALAFTQPTTST